VPWGTFTKSFGEITSNLIVFVLIIVGFAILYTINFGGEMPEFSGTMTTFATLLPDLFQNLPPEYKNDHTMSLLFNFMFGFVVNFLIIVGIYSVLLVCCGSTYSVL